MANVLLMTATVGPEEGSILSNLARNGHNVSTYNITGRWLPRESGVPMWMNGPTSRMSPMARNWFTRQVTAKNIEYAISSGVEASAFAARNYDGTYFPLLWRQQLDFSSRNETLTTAFEEILRTSSRLLLEDNLEMDKAVSKRSNLPHLKMRYPVPKPQRYLTSDSGDLVVLYSKSRKNAAEEFLRSARETFPAATEVTLLDIRTLYGANDLNEGKDFYEVLRQRLRNYSYAIFLGSSPHHSSVIRALSRDRNRIVVEQTVGMAALSHELDLPYRARGLRCLQVMKEVISNSEQNDIQHQDETTAVTGYDYLETLKSLWQETYEPWFEEIITPGKEQPLDIFFSVSAVQDVVNGARHQRIRNIYGALTHNASLNLHGYSEHFFGRRLTLANSILSEGRPAGIFYGENSTSPMPRQNIEKLKKFLKTFSKHGGRSMWYVRDLHWLGAFGDNIPWSEERHQKLINDGLYELETIGKNIDVLAAPSVSAGEGFNQLLVRRGDRSREWFPLPPAIQVENVVDEDVFNNEEGITVLYAGGISSLYSMDLYFKALLEIDPQIMIDFVVREPEVEPLKEVLDHHALLDSRRIRILHTTMDLYRSRSSRTIGTILLDSEYAKFSFPYKTVTMIERGYPILCFSDMGIANFVVSNKLGTAVDRSVRSVRDGILTLASDGAPGIQTVRKNETWQKRAHDIRQTLTRSNTTN